MPSALKLSDDLVTAARHEGKVLSRSATQQVEHWARIGRVVERMGALDAKRIRAALAAELHFDSLAGSERAVVLAELDRLVFHPDGDGELGRRLVESGGNLSELDRNGHVVMVPPGGKRSKTSGARRRRTVRAR